MPLRGDGGSGNRAQYWGQQQGEQAAVPKASLAHTAHPQVRGLGCLVHFLPIKKGVL